MVSAERGQHSVSWVSGTLGCWDPVLALKLDEDPKGAIGWGFISVRVYRVRNLKLRPIINICSLKETQYVITQIT